MAKIYYRMIKSGRMELIDVPEYWREQVKELLNADKAESGAEQE